MDLDLIVTNDVLIPRPDTEILVDIAIKNLKLMSGELKIADIGTGSGAIGISILKYIKSAAVAAVDISDRAIEVAKSNAEKYSLTNRIEFYVGDLLEPLEGKKFNAILSNPPYIPSKMIDTLQPEVADFEPRIALDGGADGLDFYRRLIADAPYFLIEGGFLAVEIGYDQAEAVKKLADSSGRFTSTEVIKDLSQKDRVFIAKI